MHLPLPRFLVKFLDLHYPATGGFQNLITFYCAQVHVWLNFHEDVIKSFYVMLLTDKQANKRRYYRGKEVPVYL